MAIDEENINTSNMDGLTRRKHYTSNMDGY